MGLLKDPITGEFLNNPQASAKVLLNKFFPDHVISDPEEDNQMVVNQWDCDLDRSTFTPDKVKKALQSFSPYKSCGTDDLKPIVFKHMGPKALSFITRSMQASYSLGYIPKMWLATKAILFLNLARLIMAKLDH